MFRIVTIAAGLLCAAAASAAAYDCTESTYQSARGRMIPLFGAGVVQNDTGGGRMSVLVADAYWRRLNFPDKQRFADDLVCAIAGAGKGLASLRLRSLSTGKTLGDWSYGRLSVE